MRENLQKISLVDNIPLMKKFDDNVQAIFELLEQLDTKTPPFPVEVNTMFLANAIDANGQPASGGAAGVANGAPPTLQQR